MRSFIRATEIWAPTPDRTELRWQGGLYGGLDSFREISEGTRFGYGEGLPGRAWADRHPIILKKFEGSYFRRTDAALAAGLTCGVALPIFAGDFILAVVVFFCGGEHEHVGAIEAWLNDPAVSPQMALADGYYGTAEFFERTSRMSKFGPGNGLPGLAWQAGIPVHIPELFRSSRFMRRDDAIKVGVNAGLGIPVRHDPGRNWVMTFLSSSGTPIARRFDVWLAAADGGSLVRQAPAEPDGDEDSSYGRSAVGPDDGPLGRILRTGMPIVGSLPGTEMPLTEAAVAAEGLTSFVALPCLTETGRIAAVACLYF